MKLIADGCLRHLDQESVGVIQKKIVQALASLEFSFQQVVAKAVGIAGNLDDGAECRRIGKQ